MATSTANLAFDNSTLANFKAWAQFISNAFSAFGWTQTTDTGQVNWGTIGAVGNVYEVWKAADSQASTRPIYVKVVYGNNSTNPKCTFTVGTGSDGAGNITGPTIGAYDVLGNGGLGNGGGTAYPCYASGDAGEIRFMMFQSNSTFCSVWGIERSKDSSGAKTTDYFTFLGAVANVSTQRFQTILGSLVTANMPILTAVPGSSATFNGTTAGFSISPAVGKQGNPMLGFCSAVNGDVSEGASVTVNIYAANHTYIATKQSNIGLVGQLATGSSGSLLMRYE